MNTESEECRLKAEYSFKDWIYWNLMLALPLMVALIGIGKQTIGGLIFYLILVLLGLGLFLRFFCPHCPHYTRKQSSFSCLFFWKVPKLFADRQGPLDLKEKVLVILAAALILVVPLFWLIETPSLLVIYLLALAVFVSTHLRNECSRCLFVDCPMNRVPEALHDEALQVK
ncbi:MAG: hypothetical protein WBG37_10050 [Desulfobacterales bacterium]